MTNIVGGGQTSLTQIDLPIGGLYRLSGGTGTDLTAMGRAATGLGGINAWRSNGPGRRYLIETDPRFVNYDNFISSDFLLDKLGVDPEWTQTRLGDGFYEQRLVLDQITSSPAAAIWATTPMAWRSTAPCWSRAWPPQVSCS